LPKNKGLNRFVWNMKTFTVPGVPKADIESNFTGHKMPPGKYSFTLKSGDRSATTTASILPNPLYATTPAEYKEFDQVMGQMEAAVTDMHNRINTQYAQQKQLESLLTNLPADNKYDAIRKEGNALLADMKAWDEDMVQRRSQAYDDVENFPNKFTANYLFLKDQTDGDIPRVNKPSLDRKAELDAQWVGLKSRNDQIQNVRIPAFNKMLWDAGIGGVWKK